MKFNLGINGRTFTVSTRTDKNATSNYDTQLNVSEDKKLVAGCTIKKSTPKKEVVEIAIKCVCGYYDANNFTI